MIFVDETTGVLVKSPAKVLGMWWSWCLMVTSLAPWMSKQASASLPSMGD